MAGPEKALINVGSIIETERNLGEREVIVGLKPLINSCLAFWKPDGALEGLSLPGSIDCGIIAVEGVVTIEELLEVYVKNFPEGMVSAFLPEWEAEMYADLHSGPLLVDLVEDPRTK